MFSHVMQSYNHCILQKAFVPGKDHVNVVEKLSKKIVGTKSPWTVSTHTLYSLCCKIVLLFLQALLVVQKHFS